MEEWERALEDAEKALEEGNYEEVVKILQGLDLVEGYLLRAEALLRRGLKDEALRELERGMEKFPFSHVILVRQAEILLEDGRFDEALERVDRALSLMPVSSDYKFLKAKILYRMENYEEVNLILADVLRVNPANVEARLMKAFSYYNMGLKLDALSEVNRALAYSKGDWKLHSLKGRIYFETGYHKLALSEFKIAMHYDPENPEHYYDVALCYYTLGMYQDSLVYVEQALSRQRKPIYLALRAKVLKALGSEDYRKDVEEALRGDPSLKGILQELQDGVARESNISD